MAPIPLEESIDDVAFPALARPQVLVDVPQLLEAVRGGVDALVFFFFFFVVTSGQVGCARLQALRSEPFERERDERGTGELGQEFADRGGGGWEEAGGGEGGGGGGGEGDAGGHGVSLGMTGGKLVEGTF